MRRGVGDNRDSRVRSRSSLRARRGSPSVRPGALFAQCGVIPPSAHATARRSPWQVCVTRLAHCQGPRIAEKLAHSPSRSPRCTSAPLPWRYAPRASTRGNGKTLAGWLALSRWRSVRNSSRRQRVSVYKHCKVTHRAAVSPPHLAARPRSSQTAESRYVTRCGDRGVPARRSARV